MYVCMLACDSGGNNGSGAHAGEQGDAGPFKIPEATTMQKARTAFISQPASQATKEPYGIPCGAFSDPDPARGGYWVDPQLLRFRNWN